MEIIQNPKPLPVMQIILDLELAGAQEVVRTLTEYLQAENCVVIVVSFRDGPMRSRIEELGVKVEILNRPRYTVVNLPMFLLEVWRIRHELQRLVETYQIEIIQTHLLEVLDFVVLSLRILDFGISKLALRFQNPKLKIFWTIHNVEILPTMPGRLLQAKRKVYRWLYRFLARYIDGFIAVSNEVSEAIITELGEQIRPKVFTINNGISDFGISILACPVRDFGFDSKIKNQKSKIEILTVGRLTEQKGHRYLIAAVAAVVSVHPQVHFLFVGEGELDAELKAQAEQSGYGAHIHFLGKRQDVSALLAKADMFVLPSLWEGLSIALLEAMAAAKPIVATAVSGTTQVMLPNKTGLIVPPHDSTALAEAINQFLADPLKAQAMGQAARQHVIANYSAEKQAKEHLALYRQII